jgi:general secretion pathway protein G
MKVWRPRRCADMGSGEAGYTLLELLVVIAILGLIVALAAPQVVGYFGRSKTKAAEIQISSLQSALELYRLDVGTYPTADQGLKALIAAPSGVKDWHGPYLSRDDGIIDPWGRAYLYAPPAPNGRVTIKSLGADGKVGGTGDDEDLTNIH